MLYKKIFLITLSFDSELMPTTWTGFIFKTYDLYAIKPYSSEAFQM